MLLFETGTLSGAITIKFACDGAGEVWPSGASYAIVKVKSGSTTVNYGASADNPLVFETSPVDMTPTADSPDAYAVGDVFYIGEYPVQ